MARTAGADSDQTRKRILEHALRLFSEHGERGASIREVAREAGVSVGMIHHYFGSKEGLYAACLSSMKKELGGLRDALLAELSASPPPAGLVDRAVRVGFRFARQHRFALGVLSAKGASPLSEASPTMASFLDRITTHLATRLGRRPRALRLPVRSLMLLVTRYAIAPYEMLRGEVGAQASASEPTVLRAVEEHLVDAAFAMLGIEGDSPGRGRRRPGA